MESVKEFAGKVQGRFKSINLLINNGKLKFKLNEQQRLIEPFLKRGFCQPHKKSPKTVSFLKWLWIILVIFS